MGRESSKCISLTVKKRKAFIFGTDFVLPSDENSREEDVTKK